MMYKIIGVGLLLIICFIALIHLNVVFNLGIVFLGKPVTEHLTILGGCIATGSFLIASWTRNLKDGYQFKCLVSELDEQDLKIRMINQKDKLVLVKRVKLVDSSKRRFADFVPQDEPMRIPAFDYGDITFEVPESVKDMEKIRKLDIWIELLEGKSVKGSKELI